jgi:peptidoglycan/xylan/chitin deacetylase (PgdA/CDA1 family)
MAVPTSPRGAALLGHWVTSIAAIVLACLVVSACSSTQEGASTPTTTPSPTSAANLEDSPAQSGSAAAIPPPLLLSPRGGGGKSVVSADPRRSGLLPVFFHVDTTDPVVFITIYDGYTKDPAIIPFLEQRHVPVTPFLTTMALGKADTYFAGVQRVTGQVPQDHSLTHPDLRKLSLAQQEKEICGAADEEKRLYGTRPWLLRPPFGFYDKTTERAAVKCGMKALVMWNASLPHSIVRYSSGSKFRPGDILLIHWRPGLLKDLTSVLDTIAADGLRVGALQDYLPGAPGQLPPTPTPAPPSSAQPTGATTSSAGASG